MNVWMYFCFRYFYGILSASGRYLVRKNIDGLVQDCSISSVLTMTKLQSLIHQQEVILTAINNVIMMWLDRNGFNSSKNII